MEIKIEHVTAKGNRCIRLYRQIGDDYSKDFCKSFFLISFQGLIKYSQVQF